MKRMILVAIFIATFMVGCSKTSIEITLEDYYLELLSSQFEKTPITKVKEDLKNYKYESKFNEYTKDLSEEEIEEMGASNMSDHIFTDTDGNELEVTVNESDKEVMMIMYKNKSKNTRKTISYSNVYSTSGLSGKDIESQKDILKKINFTNSTNDILDSYFRIVDKFSKENLKIEDIESILGADHELLDTGWQSKNAIDYLYRFENLGVYIRFEMKDDILSESDLYVDLEENSNYRLMINISDKDRYTGEEGFNLETNLISTVPPELSEEKSKVKEYYKNSNINIFKFIFKDVPLQFYSDKHKESDEKLTKLIEISLDKANDHNGVDFNSKKVVIEEDRPYDVDKTFLVNLKKGEAIKVEIAMEHSQAIETPIEISLVKCINYEDVYREHINNIGDGVFITDRVDESGDYEICVNMGDINKYRVKLYSLSK